MVNEQVRVDVRGRGYRSVPKHPLHRPPLGLLLRRQSLDARRLTPAHASQLPTALRAIELTN